MKVTRKCVCTRVIWCANTVGSRLGEANGPPRALIRQYGNLYAQARVDTLDALDALPELRHLDDLKAKLLFSVIVLAFRSVQATLMEVYRGVRRALQLPETEPLPRELETAVGNYLGGTAGRFDLRRNVEVSLGVSLWLYWTIDNILLISYCSIGSNQSTVLCLQEVCDQIWATLFDYPGLKTCRGLVAYVRDCIRVAWGLRVHCPPYRLEFETRSFRRDLHVRFHASGRDSTLVKTYLWPALVEDGPGTCVHKGVVLT
ncbi:hypothetical protein LAZ67_1002582 [Cordylochernes scorpioides]|uniref:Mitochondria-eating protein n=1 Tax=Cordylochernes scorpioides TaxID=51811 RepID=A0ABY6JWC4_9ARAC|nr:hypothetical protein LAZ67_1002582 [Cordylochernes scorpioides]